MSSGMFQKKINLGFALFLGLTALTAGLAYRAIKESTDGSRWVAHTHMVIGVLRETLWTVQQADSGQRGYLLTGQERYLAPYRAASASLPGRLALLTRLTADNPVQQGRMAGLNADVAAKMADLRETIAIHGRLGFGAAQRAVLSGRGQNLMLRIEADLAQMEQMERALLRVREKRAQRGMWSTGLVLAGSLLVEVGFLVLIRWLLRRSWAVQEQHTRALEQTTGDLWTAKIVAEQAEKQYRDIYDHAIDGIFQTTMEGRMLSANPALARLLGYETPDDLVHAMTNVGEQLYVHPGDRTRFLSLMKQNGTVAAFEAQFQRRDATTLWVSMSARLERDDLGNALYLEGTAEDITERRRAEEALRESEERFHAFMNNSPAVAFMKDDAGRYAYVNGQFERNFGISRDQCLGKTVFQCFPGDTARQLHDDNMAVLAAGHLIEIIEQVPLADGTIRQWLTFKFPFQSATGRRFLGCVALDVSAQRAAEDALRETGGQLEALIQASPLAIITFDARGIVQRGNAAAERLLGSDGARLVGLPLPLIASEAPHDWDTLRGRLAHGEAFTGLDQCWNRNGDWINLSVSAAPLYDAHGFVSGGMALIDDISHRKKHEQEMALHLRQIEDFNTVLEFQRAELEKANSELERIASTDALTGLQTRRVFDERLSLDFGRAVRYDVPLALLMVDVDNFKQHNDAFGHPMGDDILQTVGRLLRVNARETDLVARFGGEEFVLLLPHTDSAGALVVAERIRAAIEAEPWPHRPVTASFGVCTFAPGMRDQSELVDGADRALYAAKAAGRNRVVQAAPMGLRESSRYAGSALVS